MIKFPKSQSHKGFGIPIKKRKKENFVIKTPHLQIDFNTLENHVPFSGYLQCGLDG